MRGLSNAGLAASPHLGEATVKTHVTRILSKLDLRDRAQAIVVAYETGFVTPGSPGDRSGARSAVFAVAVVLLRCPGRSPGAHIDRKASAWRIDPASPTTSRSTPVACCAARTC
ncbi:response regulator transcription factor [Actinomadura namibiensis]|uniref:response regulator transcription factor n=1 Tax=Actinomadura kijaniata TaxID=46161 RepID=UPI0028AB406F|nr:LuxR C-terminal-related transcriptional regulator [Actinomadura namibiensis]